MNVHKTKMLLQKSIRTIVCLVRAVTTAMLTMTSGTAYDNIFFSTTVIGRLKTMLTGRGGLLS